jgi:hypothetical protein
MVSTGVDTAQIRVKQKLQKLLRPEQKLTACCMAFLIVSQHHYFVREL